MTVCSVRRLCMTSAFYFFIIPVDLFFFIVDFFFYDIIMTVPSVDMIMIVCSLGAIPNYHCFTYFVT